MEHVANVGDIDIYKNDNFVQIAVDGYNVLLIPREGHGLDTLVETLSSLIK